MKIVPMKTKPRKRSFYCRIISFKRRNVKRIKFFPINQNREVFHCSFHSFIRINETMSENTSYANKTNKKKSSFLCRIDVYIRRSEKRMIIFPVKTKAR